MYCLLKKGFLLAIAFSWIVPVAAQRVRLEGISVSSGGGGGLVGLPPYEAFINATRSPELFRGAGREDAVTDGTTALGKLAIDFDFSFSNRQRHVFFVGFAAQRLDATLYAIPGADSLTPGIDLVSANEYFSLRGGYRYRLRPGRKLSVFAGLVVEAGTPVSALSKETIAGDSLGHENRFFARRSGLFAVGLPVGMRIKLTRAMHLTLSLNTSRLWTRLDGNRVTVNLVGLGAGLQFRFRRREG